METPNGGADWLLVYGAGARTMALRHGIDRFGRFMVFGVPDDDLPEHAFDTALRQMTDGTPVTETDELLLRLRVGTAPYRLSHPTNTATSTQHTAHSNTQRT
ncbi:hypothetical protein ACFVTC_33495 [Streptomyces sp. NPDC057950]|uniref:hypothetical protein n=1 Tax=Streptomyces sp. NPDC057950 TaxID=3346288 RepID=UPI0036E047F1